MSVIEGAGNSSSRVAEGSSAAAAETDRASDDPPRTPVRCQPAAVEITAWQRDAIALRGLRLWEEFKAAAEQLLRPVLSLGRRRGRQGGTDSTKPALTDDEAKRHQALARNAAAARTERRRMSYAKLPPRVTPKDKGGDAVMKPRASRTLKPPPPQRGLAR